MRTTVNIDDDMMDAARHIARARSMSTGSAISYLMRKGLASSRAVEDEQGFPVFSVPSDAPTITLEDVKRLDDEWQ